MSEANATLAKAERKLARLNLKRQLAEARIRLARAERQVKVEELKTTHWWPREQRSPGAELLREALSAKRDHHADLLEGKKLGKEIPEGNFLWDWVNGYQDLIDRLRSPDGLLLSAISIAADRLYGSYWPFFRTWNDLALLRGASRILYQTSGLARGAIGGVASYIVGDGFKYRVREKEGCPAGLRLACQEILDHNSDLNGWAAIEHSCVVRDSRDGEWYLRDFPQQDGTTLTRVIEPEQLIQPGDSTLKEWSFGKRNPLDPYDVERVTGFHVCYDGVNTNGEIVEARHVLEHQANVDRTVKRGIPDLAYDVYDFLKVAGRLIENMGEGAAIQAAIAQIRQWESPVTADQAADFQNSEADYQTTNPWTGSPQNARQIRPGTIEDVPKGMTYIPPPFAQGSPAYIQVEQAILRAVAVCWNAPEWLTSGDASNNNYSSSLTAESPFVKTGSHRQNVHYKPRFLCARWRVLENYCDAKDGIVAGGRKCSWAEVRKYTGIQCEPPSMEVRNRADEASANSVRVQAGWKSRQTVAQEEGLDWEQERANIEEYNETMGQQGPPLPDDLGGGMGGLGGDFGGGADRPPSMPESIVEVVLREEGFTGRDRLGRQWVNGKLTKSKQRDKKGHGAGAGRGSGSNPLSAAHAALTAKIEQRLTPDIEEMQATPEGQAALKKSAAVAESIKATLAKGVKAAVEAVDSELGGGLSILAGGAKSRDPKAVAQGVSRALNSVFVCVHEEIFEMALAQHSLPGAHAVGMVAAKVAATAESAILKGVAWAWGKVRGVGEGRYVLEGVALTDADKKLLAAMGKVAAQAVREALAAAGVEDAEIDEAAAVKRIAELLAA